MSLHLIKRPGGELPFASAPGPIVPEVGECHLVGSEKVAFSAGSRKAAQGSGMRRMAVAKGAGNSLYAPAVALGVFEGALQFIAEHLDESRTGYGTGAGLGNVHGAVAATENTK